MNQATISRTVRIAPHAILLLVLAAAEGFRLAEFFRLLTGSVPAGVASAVVTVVVVTYLALYELNRASIFAMFVCVFLSFGSFIEPFEALRSGQATETLDAAESARLPMPEWDPMKFWTGGQSYRKAYEAEVEHVRRHNERSEAVVFSGRSGNVDFARYAVFGLGVVVMAICVPFLALVVSHRLAEEVRRVPPPAPLPPPVTAGSRVSAGPAPSRPVNGVGRPGH